MVNLTSLSQANEKERKSPGLGTQAALKLLHPEALSLLPQAQARVGLPQFLLVGFRSFPCWIDHRLKQ